MQGIILATKQVEGDNGKLYDLPIRKNGGVLVNSYSFNGKGGGRLTLSLDI